MSIAPPQTEVTLTVNGREERLAWTTAAPLDVLRSGWVLPALRKVRPWPGRGVHIRWTADG